jgi:hypothetical protein
MQSGIAAIAAGLHSTSHHSADGHLGMLISTQSVKLQVYTQTVLLWRAFGVDVLRFSQALVGTLPDELITPDACKLRAAAAHVQTDAVFATHGDATTNLALRHQACCYHITTGHYSSVFRLHRKW